MGAIFQKKGKEILKDRKIFENLGKNVQNLKIFWKRSVLTCDNCTQKASRIDPIWTKYICAFEYLNIIFYFKVITVHVKPMS